MARLGRSLADLGGHELLLPSVQLASNLVEGPSEPGLLSADVAFGQPNTADLIAARGLKFVQLTSAGWARYERPEILTALKDRGAALCNASRVYAEPCAEHVVAFMLAEARQLRACWDTGKAWNVRPLRAASRLLVGQSVLIVGYGAIAARICELLKPFGMKVKALRRSVRGDEAVPTYPIIAADELIPDADHVVNVLPGTPATASFFDARRLGLIKRGGVYYNIGRGTTTDQPALAALLRAGTLAGAYLDVTDPEPLPATHELWSAPRCHITPHTGGGFAGEMDALADHFTANLKRYLKGEPLVDRVA